MRDLFRELAVGFVFASFALAADAHEPAAVESVLAGSRSENEISALLGPAPTRCVAATNATRLCEWQLANRDPGWRPIAEAIETEDRVAVLCELPEADGNRADGSCSGHRRRSNRDLYQISMVRQRTAAERGRRLRKLAEFQQTTSAELADARSLLAMSRLLGAVPTICHPSGGASQRCIWRLSAHIWGHGTVGASIRVDLGKRLRLECELPLDGSDRADGSCKAQVGY